MAMGSDLSSGPSGVSSVREPRISRLHQNTSGRDISGNCFFSFRQRITLNGAFEDCTLPAPHVSDEKEEWALIFAGVEEEHFLQFNCVCNENAPQFERTKTVEIMMAIDPGTASDEFESSEHERKEPEEIGGVLDWYLDTVDPLEPDVAEAASASAQPTPVETA